MKHFHIKAHDGEEGRLLEEALTKIRSENGYGKNVDLEVFLQRWQRFVEKVEGGFSLGLDDYENFLLARDDLAYIMSVVPGRLAAEIGVAIAPFDWRFRSATRPSPHLLPGPERSGFWWSRVPWKIQGDLRDGLRAENLLPRDY